MSIHGMSARPETLMYLGWAARTDLRERLLELHRTRPGEADAPERVLRGALRYSQPPVFETDSVLGPVYKALFEYRLDRVQFQLVDWALRGFNAVYMADKQVGSASERGEGDWSSPETALLATSLDRDDRLLSRAKRLGREWNGEVRQAATALRLYFTFRMPLLLRTPESAFLFQEFITMSLGQVNWVELAATVLEIPYREEMLQKEERENDFQAMQLALLRERIWQTYTDLGESSQQPCLSSHVHDLCLELADACNNAASELRELEASGMAYERAGKD